MKRSTLRSLFAAIAASSLVGCLLESQVTPPPTKEAGGSDEIDTRLAVDRTGHPVSGARIALVKAGDSTGTALAISATGSDGSFPAFVVPDGFYSVVLRDPGDSLGRFVDSVHIVSRKLPSGRDTLLSLGSVRGVVKMATGDSPTSVDIALLGTDIVTAPKADGTFKIDLVPGGLYTLGAVTSLDGYGRLYKRIQVADGQNLVLPDTLVLPFTGLPVPAGLRVLQDTATGNVKVTWNRVVHPDLMGYVLERVEGGTTTFSRYLTDSTWTDSLGAYWEAMPLYGPWPARDVAYRVRSRSLSGAMDTKSAAQAITAKAPEWTKHVDSVKATMTTDSVSGVSTLRWNTPKHPDVVGWTVSRITNTVKDCADSTEQTSWTDAKCVDPRGAHLDSLVDQNGVMIYLLNGRSVKSDYTLESRRKLGVNILISGGFGHLSNSMINWRDSTPKESVTSLTSQGGWAFVNAQLLSKDGVSWENAPEEYLVARSNSRGYEWNWTAQGESVWFGKLTADSLHMIILSRIGKEMWRHDTIGFTTKFSRISEFTAIGNRVVVGGLDANQQESVMLIDSSRIRSISFGDEWKYSTWTGDGMVAPLVNGWRFDILMNGFQTHDVSAYLVSIDSIVVYRHLHGDRILNGGCIPVGNQGGFLMRPDVYGPIDYYDIRRNFGYRLDMPPTNGYATGGIIGVIASMNDEIWTMTNGHIWKGKLNLPK